MKIHDFHRRKVASEKISMVTCYDYWSAQLLNDAEVDTLLVGDSLAMVMHGFSSTVHATVPMMATHIAAVRRGAPNKFIVGDMPFLAARRERGEVLDAVSELMQAGSNAIKIEGAAGQLDTIAHIVESGVPVMGHLGLTPQSVEGLGCILYPSYASDYHLRLSLGGLRRVHTREQEAKNHRIETA